MKYSVKLMKGCGYVIVKHKGQSLDLSTGEVINHDRDLYVFNPTRALGDEGAQAVYTLFPAGVDLIAFSTTFNKAIGLNNSQQKSLDFESLKDALDFMEEENPSLPLKYALNNSEYGKSAMERHDKLQGYDVVVKNLIAAMSEGDFED